MPEIDSLWMECRDAFSQHRTWKRARRLGLCQLGCLGRHTIAGLICAGGRQADDWSADYRLFSRDRWEANDLFVPVVRGALHLLPDRAPLVLALDDTILRKTGRKIPGVGYRRDPLSPPFQVNLVPGQRFVQLSALIPAGEAPAPGPRPGSAGALPPSTPRNPNPRSPNPGDSGDRRRRRRKKCIGRSAGRTISPPADAI